MYENPPARTAAEPEARETAQLPCAGGFSYTDDRHFRGSWRRQAVVAGPLALLRLNAHAAGDFSRPRALYAKALLAPHHTTTVAVAAEDRHRVSVTSHVPQRPEYSPDDAAITFQGCAPRTDDSREGEQLGTGYAFTVMVAARGCATFEITPKGGRTMRRTVAFGVEDC